MKGKLAVLFQIPLEPPQGFLSLHMSVWSHWSDSKTNEVWTRCAFTQQCKAARLSSRDVNRVLEAREETMDRGVSFTVNCKIFLKQHRPRAYWFCESFCCCCCCCCNMRVCAPECVSIRAVHGCRPEVRLRCLPPVVSILFFWDNLSSLNWSLPIG